MRQEWRLDAAPVPTIYPAETDPEGLAKAAATPKAN